MKEEKWNAEQLAAIEKQLADIDLLAGYYISILGERELANLAIDQIVSNPKPFSEMAEGEFGKIGLVPQGWIRQNQRRLNEMHVNFSQRIVDAKARRIHPDIALAFNKELDAVTKQKFPVFDVLSSMLLPAIDKVAVKSGSAQAAVDHSRIACLLELHKLEHETYPAKLTDLKTPLPNDPYNGKPYVYKPDGKDRYQLYGIGWNQKGDGGKVILKGSDHPDLDKGDLVWSNSPATIPKGK